LGNFVEGVYFLSYKNIKDEPSFTEKLVELRIKGREPKGLGVYGFAAVDLWAQMVRDAKSVDFNKLDRLKDIKAYEMPWGVTKFDKGSAVNFGDYALYQIKNGEYTQAD
jgi:branched-chain amino acid transport system substrate-binding protein